MARLAAACVALLVLAGSVQCQQQQQQQGASGRALLESTNAGSTGQQVQQQLPYDLDAIPDLPTLLWRHQHYQTAALLGTSAPGGLRQHRVLLVNTNDGVGLGNRLPSIVTGYALALLTGRLLMLHSSLLDFVDTPFPSRWGEHMGAFAGTRRCNAHWSRLLDPALALCNNEGGSGDAAAASTAAARQLLPEQQQEQPATIVAYSSIDYDVPLLQINPALSRLFERFFPDGEVAAALLPHLLRPKPVVAAALAPYAQRSADCLVGLHIRTRKYDGVRVRQFARIAKSVSRGQAGNVFVASDANLFPGVTAGLPGRLVWWSNTTQDALATAVRTRGNNPGSELSAVLDLLLLSRCKHLVLTPASSLGAVAAALGGVKPVYANFGRHEDPFLNPWFWGSVTSEPCMFKAAAWHVGNDSLAARFLDAHPLALYHSQCHYQSHLRRVPAYLKQSTANATYLAQLLE